MPHLRFGIIMGAVVATTACAPRVNVRKDIFQGRAVWEAGLVSPRAAGRVGTLAVTGQQAPGLYYLSKQVLGTSEVEARRDILAPAQAAGSSLYAADENPLPERVAALKVTRVVVDAAQASCFGRPVEDRSLSPSDFRRFAEELSGSYLALYQDPEGALEADRLAKLTTFTQGRRIILEGLMFAYFSAYYQGTFVDRIGGKLSKPSIGLKIPNETITSALTVGLEAIYDYGLVSCSAIRDPLVYTPKSDGSIDTFETKDGNEPTLVSVVLHASNGRLPVPGVLEPLQADDTRPGLTKAKLRLIKTVSGYASDAGGTVADLITRSIGGVGGAFVLFGKISIGDNDTLAKIIETTVDVTARRTTEASVAAYLYDKVQSAPSSALNGILSYPGPARPAVRLPRHPR